MRIYTCDRGVKEGALVEGLELKGVKKTIPAILVGEKGRGRSLGVVPVHLLPDTFQEWNEKGSVMIHHADLSQTRSGKPKLKQTTSTPDTEDHYLVVARTQIGYRGGNKHEGDLTNRWKCWCGHEGEGKVPEICPECGRGEYGLRPCKRIIDPWPGKDLSTGIIAQGAAGRAGSGEQKITVLPKKVVWWTGYSGRLYGAPSGHYYYHDGEDLLSATREERDIADLF